MRRATFRCPAKSVVIGNDVELAESVLDRTIGLLGRTSLAETGGLLLRECSSIHMWFMLFSIDVVFLDEELTIMRIARSVPPFWFAIGPSGTRHTLELSARHPALDGLVVGDRLSCDLNE